MKFEEECAIFAKYLSEAPVLIADSNSSARVGLATTLSRLGSKNHLLNLVGTYEEAEAAIQTKRPKLILCDFYLGSRAGLDLLQDQKKNYPDARDTVFAIVTSSTSQSVVARAAEEDVDTFVLKPYTLELLKRSLVSATVSKLHPSDYIKTINIGKEHLFDGELNAAITHFDQAMNLDPKPTLALFYRGQAEVMRNSLEAATRKFKDGLSINKIHYKCLTGLYDIFMKDQRYDEAYEVVKKTAQYFPANPKRLAAVLRLAILTRHYEDIESYYQIFTRLDQRNDELIRYICAALNVTGKYYLTRKTTTRALELFEKAAVSSAGKTKVLRYIIETLLEFNMAEEAGKYLRRFPANTLGEEDYLAMEYAVSGHLDSDAEVIQRGRKLISEGVNVPIIYQTLIEHSLQAGYTDSALELVQAAQKHWPEKSLEFSSLLQRFETV